jgi:cell wall-associated NlpC family hydrolase
MEEAQGSRLNTHGIYQKGAAIAALEGELSSWLGTPYRHKSAVKQGGADCIGFLVGVLKNQRVLAPNFKIPIYPPDWHLHKDREILLNEFLKRPELFIEVSLDELRSGDIVLFKFGKTLAHCAIYFETYAPLRINTADGGGAPTGEIYHSVSNIGVIKTPYSQWRPRARRAFRIIGAPATPQVNTTEGGGAPLENI